MVYFRRLPEFEYLAPATVADALSLLSKHKGKARLIAGGTDILNLMKTRQVVPQYLIGLKGIKDLEYIKYSKTGGLRIGALTTLESIECSAVVREKYGILAQAVCSMASTQIRNVATMAGNICSAVPSADTAPPLIVLGAKLKLVGPNGGRVVDVEDFFIDPCQTVIQDSELLTEIHVPSQPDNSKGVYLKRGLRRALNPATVSVAVLAATDDGYCKDIRIALGAVAPIPLRATGAERVLRGKKLNNKLVEEAAGVAAEEARPISDFRASAEHRKELIRVLTARAITEAISS